MDYEQLLKKAKKELPEIAQATERFEMPKVKGHVEGNKTIVSNFNQICDALGREQDRLLKYLQRELATPAVNDGQRLIFGRKLNAELINKKVEQFAKDFVICKSCGKPDTNLIREGRIMVMRCAACGAKQPVVSKL
jgi:translation initiation factor 2 subunit 2